MMSSDQPSETMWCRQTDSTWSSAPTRNNVARNSGPAARSNGRDRSARSSSDNRAPRYVHDRQFHRRRGQHDLNGLVIGGGQHRTERLVPADDLGERRGQRRHVEGSGQPQHQRDRVRSRRVDLVEEPQPVLRHGERQRCRRVRARSRRRAGRTGARSYERGEPGDGRVVEHGVDRQVRAERRPAAGRRAGSRAASGRPARRSRRAHRAPVDAEQFLPHGGDLRLGSVRGAVLATAASRTTGVAPTGSGAAGFSSSSGCHHRPSRQEKCPPQSPVAGGRCGTGPSPRSRTVTKSGAAARSSSTADGSTPHNTSRIPAAPHSRARSARPSTETCAPTTITGDTAPCLVTSTTAPST